MEQEQALEAFEARKAAAAEGEDNMPLDEAVKVEIQAMDQVVAN